VIYNTSGNIIYTTIIVPHRNRKGVGYVLIFEKWAYKDLQTYREAFSLLQ